MQRRQCNFAHRPAAEARGSHDGAGADHQHSEPDADRGCHKTGAHVQPCGDQRAPAEHHQVDRPHTERQHVIQLEVLGDIDGFHRQAAAAVAAALAAVLTVVTTLTTAGCWVTAWPNANL